jgi:AcrR family transcriptional regulator
MNIYYQPVSRPRTVADAAILAAAARAIGRAGPGALTLGAIAAEVGLAPATLVQRFGSKRGLLLALAADGAARAAEPFAAARGRHPSPLAALLAALAGLMGVERRAELANHIAFLQMDVADPELRVHATAGHTTMRREIAALLDQARAAGELEPGIDADRLARAVQVAFNGSLITWALAGDGAVADAIRADVGAVLDPHRP